MIVRTCIPWLSLWFFMDFVVLAMRGPHHPRNQEVVRSHVHYKPMPPKEGDDHIKLTQDRQLIQDEAHIREDMSGKISEESMKNMSPEEMEFYYFKLHDFDNDSRLDGLELLKAIDHVHSKNDDHDHGHDSDEDGAEGETGKDKHHRTPEEDLYYFTQLIDEVLLSDDTNNDGYLSYAEYTIGKRKGLSRKAVAQEKAAARLTDGENAS